ncbi:MAG: UDP-N-acetylglucosamine 2-epimerase, partial [Nitrososphaerota archaeon]
GFPIIYPIHPRARKRMVLSGITVNGGVKIIEPLDYLGFLMLESKARLVLTDSGGVQEETCILRVPCVTLRYNTERPETIEVGSNILAGTEPYEIVKKVRLMLNVDRCWDNPFGDGRAGLRIVKVLRDHYG